MTALAHAFTLALLHFLWQGTAVAALLWVALVAMRRRSANSRYLLSCGAMAVLVLLPVLTACFLYERPAPAASVFPESALALSAGFVLPAGPTSLLSSLQAWAVPVWCFGVLLFSARLMWGSRQVSLMRRRGEPAEEGLSAAVARIAARMNLSRQVEVLISAVADGPSVVGLMRPVVLLPAATVLGLTPEQLEAVLAHELAHIRRYDYLVNVLQMLGEALLFYHPAVWWTSARIRCERELCCDDEAVRACGDSFCYARALTALERLRITAPTMALGSTDGPLAYRIKRLMGIAAEENLPSKIPGIAALCLALACLAIGVNRVRAQAQPDAPGVRVDLGSSPVIHRGPVDYPAAAQIANVKGTVSVEVHLDSRGNVSDARVLSGPDELRKPMLQSVLGWHFAPGAAGSTRVVNVQFDAPPPEKAKVEPEPFDDSNVRRDLVETTQFLREQIDRAKANLERAQEQLGQNQDVLAAREAEIGARQAEFKALEEKLVAAEVARQVEFAQAQAIDGQMLSGIRLLGLGISTEDFIAQTQLPVRVGDTLTKSSLEAATAAVKKFDEHLRVAWRNTESGVELIVSAPGANPAPGARGGRGAGTGGGAGAGAGGGIGGGAGAGINGPSTFQAASGQTGVMPVVLSQSAPEYTEEARKAKRQGSVMLSLVVDKAGHPTDIQVTRPLGMGLDQKAIEAVQKWQFKPGTIDGNPAPVKAVVKVDFRLP